MEEFNIWKKPNGEKMSEEEIEKELSDLDKMNKFVDGNSFDHSSASKILSFDELLEKENREKILKHIGMNHPLFKELRGFEEEIEKLESDTTLDPQIKKDLIKMQVSMMNDLLKKSEKIVQSN